MNILFISVGHISKYRGGIDRVTDTLTHTLMHKGHQVYHLSLWKPHSNDEVEAYQYFLPSQEILSDENIKFVKQLLSRLNIDVLVNHADYIKILQLLASCKQNTPLISVIHTDPAALLKGITDTWDKWKYERGTIRFYLELPYWWARRIFQQVNRGKSTKDKLRLWYEKNEAVVLLSKRFFPTFKKYAGLDDDSKLYAIANPIAYTNKALQTNKDKVILFVGRLDFQKRLDRILKCWSEIKNHNGWRLVVLGDGDYREKYEQRCREMHLLDVYFYGTVKPDFYYDKASILCLSSSYEGFSMVILEALNYGVIPLAFDSYEAVHDLIENGENGYIIPAFKIYDMKRQLISLMNNDDLRQRLQKGIYRINAEKRFDEDNIADQWICLFEKLIHLRTNNS